MGVMTVRELILLDEDSSKICGWMSGGNIRFERDVTDIHYYCDIHPSVFDNVSDLLLVFNNINEKLHNIWGQRAKNIRFLETGNEFELSQYYVDIELAETMEE